MLAIKNESPSNDTIRDLADHAAPSLDILRATWLIQHSDSLCPPLPDHAIIFGLIYDLHKFHLVAHFLNPKISGYAEDFDYVSILLDTFDFPSSLDFAEWSDTRARLVLALLTVQKHVFRLSTLWHDFRYPLELSRLSTQLDNLVMGPLHFVPDCNSTDSQLSEMSRFALYSRIEPDIDLAMEENARKPYSVQLVTQWLQRTDPDNLDTPFPSASQPLQDVDMSNPQHSGHMYRPNWQFHARYVERDFQNILNTRVREMRRELNDPRKPFPVPESWLVSAIYYR